MRVAPVPREESTQTGAQDLKPSEEGLEFQTQGRRQGAQLGAGMGSRGKDGGWGTSGGRWGTHAWEAS